MNTNRSIRVIAIVLASLLAVSLCLSGCGAGPLAAPTPTAVPTPALSETGWKDYAIPDFAGVHAPVGGDANQHLIFGAVPVSEPQADLPGDLAVFLGRWEGYDYSPPVRRDAKGVLIIQEISASGGRALLWAGTNLQYPIWVKEIKFRVVAGPTPYIEWQADADGEQNGPNATFRFAYDPATGRLRGGVNFPSEDILNGPTEFERAQSFFVYKDYARYLADLGIEARTYRNDALARDGAGYLLYLPDGYDSDPQKTWPMIYFLHGSGDRGDNILALAKASPFMMVREHGPLPAIIAAPLVSGSSEDAPFPLEYLDGALDEVLSEYRVDKKRVYLTGLSMGGEATYRLAVNRPEAFAAIAPLCAFVQDTTLETISRLTEVPVWAIHGADDTVVPPALGQAPVMALEQAGGDVRFTVLPGHDHDVWTDTYSDPEFYDWLLQHRRP